MKSQFPESQSTIKKIIRSVWFWILIGLVIVATLVFIILPVGIDYGIERYLIDQGADQVSLEDAFLKIVDDPESQANLKKFLK